MEYIGCIFIILTGTLGHFLYEMLGHTKIAGLLFAVNESTWEHIKLSIYPSFLWFAIEMMVRGYNPSLVTAQAASMLTMIILIPGLFYLYTAFTRKNWLICDILCFVAAIILGMLVFSNVYTITVNEQGPVIASWCIIAAVAAAYFTLTYHAPHCFLFKDPLTGKYGPSGHKCHEHFHHTSDCGCK